MIYELRRYRVMPGRMPDLLERFDTVTVKLFEKHGITQVVVDRTDAPAAHETGSLVRTEFVVSVVGTVAKRLPGTDGSVHHWWRQLRRGSSRSFRCTGSGPKR